MIVIVFLIVIVIALVYHYAMGRTLGIIAALACVLLPAPAHARAKPTMYLVLHAPGVQEHLPRLKKSLRSALRKVPRRFRVVIVGSAHSGVETSKPLSPRKRKTVLAQVERQSQGSLELDVAIRAALGHWGGAPKKLRHHMVVISAGPLEAEGLAPALTAALLKSFTVSFISFNASMDSDELERLGAGRARSVTHKTLTSALRWELGWTRLKRSQRKKIQAVINAEKERGDRQRTEALIKKAKRYGLYVLAAMVALFALFVLRKVLRWRKKRNRQREVEASRRRRQEARDQALRDLSAAHAGLMQLSGELQQTIQLKYAIFPCPQCEETTFTVLDVTTNARSVELECVSCEDSEWAKRGVTEDLRELGEAIRQREQQVEQLEQQAQRLDRDLYVPPLTVTSNATEQQRPDGKQEVRVVVREQVRPSTRTTCKYCGKESLWESNRCPECGAREGA